MKLGLIPYGWSDGYPKRIPENATALLHGKRVRLLGPTHSELLRVDLTDVPDARIGDEVVLLGRQGNDEIDLEELSAQWKVGNSRPLRRHRQVGAAALPSLSCGHRSRTVRCPTSPCSARLFWARGSVPSKQTISASCAMLPLPSDR